MATASSAESGSRKARLLCAGIAVLDHVFKLDRFPVPGEKSRARDFAEITGGNAANAAIAAARLGGRVSLCTPVAPDLIGSTIRARLEAEGIDCSAMVVVPGATSSISAIIVDGAGERMIVNRRSEELSAARMPDPDAALTACDALLIDNRFPEFALPIAQAARRRDLPVVLDADEPTRLTEELLRASTHVIFSAHGLRDTANCDEPEKALRQIARRTEAYVSVTSGAAGALWIEGGEMRRMPAFAVEAVDTLGAGDVYHGAFALALAEGQNEATARRFAAAAAALKCTRFGGSTAAPTRAEVEAFLAVR